MSNITDVFFFIGFAGMIGIFGYSLYNIFTGLKNGSGSIFFSFAGYFVAWFLSLVAFLSEPEVLIYRVLFQFGSLFLTLNTLLCIIAFFVHLGRLGQNPQRERKFSNMEV